MTLRLGGDGAITGCTSLEEPTLSISGLSVTTPIQATSGTAAAPSYTFSGDTDNGLYYAGTNSIGLATAGTNAILIDSSGKVGIKAKVDVGTAGAPVVADTAISAINNSVDPTIYVENKGTGTVSIKCMEGIDVEGHVFFTKGNQQLRIGDAADVSPAGTTGNLGIRSGNSIQLFTGDMNEKMRIDSLGNVGIGVTSVSSSRRVEIKQPSSYSAAVRILADGNGNDGNLQWFSGLSQYEIGITQGTDALKFQRDGSEKLRIDSSGRLLVGSTSAYVSDANFQVTDDTNAKFVISNPGNATYSLAVGTDNALAFKDESNGAERMRVDITGKVGIGTSSPSNKLDVNGSVSAYGTLGNTGYAPAIHIGLSGGNPSIASGNNVNGTFLPLVFRRETTTGAAESMRIDSAGSLLVGTSTTSSFPDRLISVGHHTRASSYIDIRSSTVAALLFADGTSGDAAYRGQVEYHHSTDSMRFWTGATERMRIDSSGNVFISGSTAATAKIAMYESGAMTIAGEIKIQGTSTPAGRSSRISKYGSLLIGTTSDAVGDARCSIDSGNGMITAQDATINNNVTVNNNLAVFSGAGNIYEGYNTSTGSNVNTFAVNANGNATFAGNITAANVSDIRFKENITDANSQLADTVALGSQLKNFDWNDDAPLNDELRAKRFLGLVAQEAEKVCPGLTYTIPRTKQGAELTPETTDAEGNVTPATYEELDDSYKAINHDILVMKLLGAVAELSAEVAALKAG